MVIYNPRRSTERLQELIVDLSSTSKKKTSETLERGSKVYQQGQNAIKREFQGVQEAINTLQTNHQMVTKNRADIFDAHQKDNEYVQALINKNVEREIKNIDAKARTELKNSESWRKIIGVGAEYALKQAQKHKAEVKAQGRDLANTGNFNSIEDTKGLDYLLKNQKKDRNTKEADLIELGVNPDKIELMLGKNTPLLIAMREQAAINYAANELSLLASGASDFGKATIVPTTGGSPTTYYKLLQRITSDPNYKTPEGYKSAGTELGIAQSAVLREIAKDYGNDKLFNKFIRPAFATHFQKSSVTSLKPLLKDVAAKQKEIAFAQNYSTIWEHLKNVEGLNVDKTLTKISAHWWEIKPPNVSAEEWAMKYATDIMSFGINSGKVSRHQARMHLKHTVYDRTTKTKMRWDKKFNKAAEAVHETLKASRLKASQIAAAEAKVKKDYETGLVNEFDERFKENMLNGNKDIDSWQDSQLMVEQMLKSGNYPPDVVARIKQRTFLGPTSAPMIAGKEFLEEAISIVNNPDRKLTYNWILENGKHVPPSIKDDVIELWRTNGGDGPKKGTEGHNALMDAETSMQGILFGKKYGDAKWLVNGKGVVDFTVRKGLRHAKKKFNSDLIKAYNNNGNNWEEASATAWKAFQEDLKGTKENPSIYAIETDKKGRKWMPHFENQIKAVPEPEDHLGDYNELHKTLGNRASLSSKFEPIPDSKLETLIGQWNNGEPLSWDTILDKLKERTGLSEEQLLTNLAVGYNLRNEDIIGRPPLEVKSNPRFDELMEAARGLEKVVTAPYSRECAGLVRGNVTLDKDWSIRNCTALGQTDKLSPYGDLTGEGYNLEELQLLKQETDAWSLDRIKEPGGMRT